MSKLTILLAGTLSACILPSPSSDGSQTESLKKNVSVQVEEQADLPVAEQSVVKIPKAVVMLEPGYDPTRSFADLIEAIQPAVVTVQTKTSARMDPRLRQFFNAPTQDRSGIGSGFIVSSDGVIVTNHHVIDHADQVTVQFADGEEAEVEILGSDRSLDIAVLKLKEKRNWTHLQFADAKEVRVGDRVLALGNGLGLGPTVTSGIISGKGRELGNNVFGREDFFQTDAAINQGNSGGPLVNLNGEVVGMNTAIIAGANTVGFSISADLISSVMDDLKNDGRVARGYLGVGPQDLTPELARVLEVEVSKGAVIAGVFEQTPALDAGLRRGDVVVSVDGAEVDSARSLIQSIATKRPGEVVKLGVVRTSGDKVIKVTLGARPAEHQQQRLAKSEPERQQVSSLGVALAPLTAEVAAREGVRQGVLVTEVNRDGAASNKLLPGDIIVEVNRRAVNSPADVQKLLSRSTGNPFLVVVRDRAQLLVVIPRKK